MSRRPPPDPVPGLTPLEATLEQERSRLTQAHAVLSCLRVALLYADDEDGSCDLGQFADAAQVARELIGESVDRLDSATLRPMLKRAQR